MELEIDPLKYPWDVSEDTLVFKGENFKHTLTHWHEVNAKTNAPQCGTEDLYFVDHPGAEPRVQLSARRISARRVQLCLSGTQPFFAASHVGNTLVLRHHPRSHPCFYALDSSHLSLLNISVYHATGIAFLAERCKTIHLQRFNVCLNPKTPRVFTAIADATHFVNCEGKITIQNCLFENQLDDTINIHGIYGVVRAKIGARTLQFGLTNEMQQGVYIGRAGQTISIFNKDTLQSQITSTIVSVARLSPDLFELALSDDLPKTIAPGDVVENITQKPEALIEDCVFRNNRARGILLTCHKATVQNCRFKTAGAAVLMEGDAQYWFESGAASRVKLLNNEFINCAYIPAWGKAPIQVTLSAQQLTAQYYHDLLQIIGNRFHLIDNRLIFARNIREIDLQNNQITKTKDYPPIEGAAYDLEQVGVCTRAYTCC